MRIHSGWFIKALKEDAWPLDGAEILDHWKIRDTYAYTVRMANGAQRSVSRRNLLRYVSDGSIEFSMHPTN